MSTPEVRVRLTPEGVKEVQDALRRVQRQVGQTSRQGAGGINALRTSLVGLRSVIATIGVAAIFRSVVRETVQAEQELAQLDAALRSTGNAAGYNRDQLVSMAEGLSRVSTLSTGDIIQAQTRLLSYSSIVGNQFPRALQIAIDQSVRLGQTVTQAAEIVGQAIETPSKGVVALTRQGFRFTEAQRKMFKSLEDSGRLAEAQAQVMDVLEESYGGAARAARNTFGGAMTAVGHSIQDLMQAEDGLPGATRELNELSEVLRDPGLRRAADTLFSGLIRGGAAAVNWIGQVVGGLNVLAGRGHDPIVNLDLQIEELDRAIERAKPGLNNFWNVFAGDSILNPLIERRNELLRKQRQLIDDLGKSGSSATPPATPPPAPPPTASPALLAARRSAERDAINQELRLTQERLRQREAEEKRGYESGLISLQTYFARRIQLVREGQAAEEEAAARTIGLIRQEPTDTPEEAAKQQAQIEKVRGDLAFQRLKTEEQIRTLAAEQFDIALKAAEQLPQVQQEILELTGREADAKRVALAYELNQRREMLRQAGLLTEAVEADLQRLQSLRVAEIDFSNVTDGAERALADLSRQRERIEQDVELGITTQLGGQRQILAIERERLPILQQMVIEARKLAEASGNPELIERAEQLALSVGQVAVSVARASDEFGRFRDQATTAITSDLSNWLADGVTDADSLGDAFRNLAVDVIGSIRRIAAEILARQAILSLVSALGGPAAGVGAAVTAATGGHVRGPGTSTSDSIPALLSDNEFVTKARVVKKPGGLQVLHALNREQWNPAEILEAMRARPRVRRFAEGGLATTASQFAAAPETSAKIEGGVDIRLQPGLVGELITSPAGERALLKVLQANRRSIRNALGV